MNLEYFAAPKIFRFSKFFKRNCLRTIFAPNEDLLPVVVQWSEAAVAIVRSWVRVPESNFSQGNCATPDAHFQNGIVISIHLKQ